MPDKPVNSKALYWLYIIIGIGLILRFCYPFFSNPLDHIYSDSGRHYYEVAPGCFGRSIHSLLDPPLPQFWLRLIFFVFTNTATGVALGAGLLCAVTPWFWYRWARELFSSKEQALIFFAVITFLPSWIGIYSYFMDENLVLPMLGLALWLSWRAKRKQTSVSMFVAMLIWGLAMSTKLNLMVELLIILPWLFASFIKHNGSQFRTYATIFVSGLILLLAYLMYPLWVYQGLGATWLFPPGSGAFTKGYYLSGARKLTGAVVIPGKSAWNLGRFESPSLNEKSFEPLFKWQTCRTGEYNAIINCNQKVCLTVPSPDPSWTKRLQYMSEAALHFFLGKSWPDDREDDLVQNAQVKFRWVWFLLTLFIIILAIRKKQLKSLPVILCLGSAMLYIFCGSAVIEGRYRKPWEGIALAAFIFLTTQKKLNKSPTSFEDRQLKQKTNTIQQNAE